MNPELRQFIEQALPHRGSVEGVAERLPADDAELDALIGETVQENDVKAFLHVVVAALSRERRVDARTWRAGRCFFRMTACWVPQRCGCTEMWRNICWMPLNTRA